ncbi:MAG: hypothetical protein R2770_00280 [Acidimicrobiales bacterium]|nr:hypothetical protein [Acidimicrobiales bacterium]
MGERVGDRPLPPGVRRRDKRVEPEVRRRRGDPDDLDFERREPKLDDGELAGTHSPDMTTVAGSGSLTVPAPSDSTVQTGDSDVTDLAPEPVLSSAPEDRSLPPLSSASKSTNPTRGFEEFWLHRLIPARAMVVMFVLAHVAVAVLLYLFLA